jgi:hypothetical protein
MKLWCMLDMNGVGILRELDGSRSNVLRRKRLGLKVYIM